MNLTPLRLRALRIVHQRPGINAQELAYELVDRNWHPQGATRWGASYVEPLVLARLITTRRSNVGYACLYLTGKGEEKLREVA